MSNGDHTSGKQRESELIKRMLPDVVEKCRSIQRGRTARYIPQLVTAESSRFGIAVCSVDGHLESAGEAETFFTIQSACKPFLYGLALMQFSPERVHRRVGAEPTGQEFNSFTRLDSTLKRPANPMINAGALAISDLLLADAQDPGAATSGIFATLGRFAGRGPLECDGGVLESEQLHAARNRVIAYLMKHFGLVSNDVEALLHFYFSACAVLTNCRDLAVMAGCLANDGVNPVTNERLLSSKVTSMVLTVMTTCGMYDRSGRFAYEVGLPAKSGVSGAVLAVAPGRFGIAAYSPRLDGGGNSVRGWAAMRRISSGMRTHFMGVENAASEKRSATSPGAGLEESFRIARAETDGHVAQYLPRVDGSLYAAAICTIDGQELAHGDADHEFSLQAVSNALAFAFALARHGERSIRKTVGVEPSGNPFHAILIDERRRRPFNPLGNAGALVIAGLDTGALNQESGDDFALNAADLAGLSDVLRLDTDTLDAEWAYANRNRAIANYLHESGALIDIEDALERYLKRCATFVTCRQLARIAATLANSGRRPWDAKQVLPGHVVRKALAVMYTCGMHDHSGRFALEIGIPSKSGLSGGILAVVPGRMGIAAYSPRVDEAGASVRGYAMLRHLSTELGLGMFHGRRKAAP